LIASIYIASESQGGRIRCFLQNALINQTMPT